MGIINQDPRFYDENNGASVNSTYGLVYDMEAAPASVGGCGGAQGSNYVLCYANGANSILGVPVGPGGYYLGSANILTPKNIEDRENVFNFHFGLPHKNDTGKDDIQLLYDSFQQYTNFYNAPNDWGGGPSFFTNNPGSIEGPGQPLYFSGAQYLTPVGTVFTHAAPGEANNVVPYAYPNEGNAFLNDSFTGQNIPGNSFEGYSNGEEIYKLQYQHNIGTQSYLRAYVFSNYSWWFIQDPQGAYNLDFGLAPDYELWTHTRGASANYVNQLSPKNLLNIEGTYSTASTVRDNNTQMFDTLSGVRGDAAQLVSAANPTSGICYNEANPMVPSSCLKATRGGGISGNYLSFGNLTCGANCLGSIGNFFGPGVGIPDPNAVAGVCPGGCAWYVSENGPYATFNTVTPRFWGVSAQDTWKPNDRLNFNIGVRDDVYTFVYTPTGTGTRPYWFNAWNAVACVNPLFNGGNPIDETSPGGGLTPQMAGTPCSALGAGFTAATLTDTTANGGQITYNEVEPRFGGTYSFSTNDVLRFSAGRYSEPANAAFQQYNSLDQDLPEHLLGSLFYKYGFTSPDHVVTPSISYNYDLSWEHQFANTQTSFVLTPFLRKTNNQVQQIYIAPTQAFVSGLNVGNETNLGLEFLANMGNFNNNGFAGQLAYTYTHSYITYNPLPNGTSVLAQDNIDIQHYNSFTAACVGAVASASPTSLCGTDGGNNALPTEVGGVANPYYNAPAQGLLSSTAQYAPYDIVPVGVQLSSIGYVVPQVVTLIVQYKKDKWAFVPSFQFHGGQKYGAPETTYGFDPSSCAAALASPVTGDPRYPYGGSGTAADATSCGGSLVVPDPYTGKFDQPGAFTEPNQYSLHMGISYAATPRVSYQLNLANIVNYCSGGSKEPWTLNDNHWCLYSNSSGFFPPVGNFYNPGDTIQPQFKYPYFVNATGDNGSTGTVVPFNATFNVQFKM